MTIIERRELGALAGLTALGLGGLSLLRDLHVSPFQSLPDLLPIALVMGLVSVAVSFSADA